MRQVEQLEYRYLRQNLTADLVTFHQADHPKLEVTGDRASARWYLHDKVLVPAYDVAIEGAAFYEDRVDVEGRNRVRRLTCG